MRTAIFGACVLAVGCTLEPAEGLESFGAMPSPTGITATDGGGDASSDGASSDDTEGSSGPAPDADADASTEAVVDDTAADTSGGEGGGESTSDDAPIDGDEPIGPACDPVVDLVATGAGGGANADQTCPTTTFTTQVVGSPGPIASVSMVLDADVATTSEFTATLRSPSGTEVVLFAQHGSPFTDDFVATHFDDAAATPIATAPAPRSGCFTPDGSLATFAGQQADGPWTLTVQTCLYAATIHTWELRLKF